MSVEVTAPPGPCTWMVAFLTLVSWKREDTFCRPACHERASELRKLPHQFAGIDHARAKNPGLLGVTVVGAPLHSTYISRNSPPISVEQSAFTLHAGHTWQLFLAFSQAKHFCGAPSQ